MADDGLVDQSEIEQMLNSAGPGPKAKQPESPPAAAGDPAPLDQSEIESLLGGGGGGKSAPAPAAEEDDDKLLGQDDIEKLLNQAGPAPEKPVAEQAAPPQEAAPPPSSAGDTVPQQDIEFLLNQAEQALESINSADADDLPQGVASFRLEEFSGAEATVENATLDLIQDVELDLKIELGRTNMYLEDVLKLRKGSVVPLDKLAGDPVDIYVNGRLIARGEVLVLNDNFCVRVAELITGSNVFI